MRSCFDPYRFSDANALEFLYSLSQPLLQSFLSGPQSPPNMSFLAVWELSDSWEAYKTHTHTSYTSKIKSRVDICHIWPNMYVGVWPKGQRSEMFKGQISTSCSRLQHKQSDWPSRLGWGCVLHLFQCYERGKVCVCVSGQNWTNGPNGATLFSRYSMCTRA